MKVIGLLHFGRRPVEQADGLLVIDAAASHKLPINPINPINPFDNQ